MNSSIGGYFELELPYFDEYHNNAIRLNTGRNAFEYILRAKGYKKVYLPYYTCDVMLEAITKLNLEYEFYAIDSNFSPTFDFNTIKDCDVFVYNNYFGICHKQTNEVASNCKNLIIDNSQAFYSKPIKDVDTFYSPRKFFGLPDGAYLYTDTLLNCEKKQDVSQDRCTHLLGRIDTGAENNYMSFVNNDFTLNRQPIMKMSNLTRRLLQSINYENIANCRIGNFNFLHDLLKDANELKLTTCTESEIPLVYPLLISNGNSLRMELIKKKIFVARYWPNVLEWCQKENFEYRMSFDMISIPIDQRYNKDDMKYIVDNIFKYFK